MRDIIDQGKSSADLAIVLAIACGIVDYLDDVNGAQRQVHADTFNHPAVSPRPRM